jgi:drug/metabolite transporter (DMT)-like permease
VINALLKDRPSVDNGAILLRLRRVIRVAEKPCGSQVLTVAARSAALSRMGRDCGSIARPRPDCQGEICENEAGVSNARLAIRSVRQRASGRAVVGARGSAGHICLALGRRFDTFALDAADLLFYFLWEPRMSEGPAPWTVGSDVTDHSEPTRHHPVGRVYALLLLTAVLWGAGPVAGKIALQGIPTITVGMLRFGVASLALFLVAHRRISGWRTLGRHDLLVVVLLGILGAAVNHLFYFFALGLAPASHASIIAPTTSPIWTVLLAARLSGERIVRAQIAGILLCVVGVVLVVRPSADPDGNLRMILLGDVLFLLAGLSWGIYSYLCKMAMRRHSAETILAYAIGIGGLLLVPMALPERPWVALRTTTLAAWGGLAYLVVANTLLAYLWWNRGIQQVGAGRTAIFSNLVPPFGVLIAGVVLGERLAVPQLLGGVLCLVGVWVCQRPASPAGKAKEYVAHLRPQTWKRRRTKI